MEMETKLATPSTSHIQALLFLRNVRLKRKILLVVLRAEPFFLVPSFYTTAPVSTHMYAVTLTSAIAIVLVVFLD